MIEVRNIQPKQRKGYAGGQRTDTTTVYNADIEPGKSIRLHGIHQKTPFDVTFELGGIAEYDSYNLHYLGKITKITGNTVTIAEKYTGDRTHRLDLYTFSWRNYDFNLEKIDADNLATSQSI